MVNRIAMAVVVALGACTYAPPGEPSGDASAPPVVAFEFPTSGTDEGAANAQGANMAMVPVVLSKASDSTVTVECGAIAGGSATEVIDFSVITHTVTFAPGVTRVEVEVDIEKDFDDNERAETIDLALSSPKGAILNAEKAIHEITIADHVLPRIRFDSAESSTDEGIQTILALQLDLPADGESTVVLGVTPTSVAGIDSEDIALQDGKVITIPAGAMSLEVPIGEVNDPYDELPMESVTFELKGASQNLVVDTTKRTRLHSIADNDLPPVVQFKISDSAFDEDAGTVAIEVELTEESQLPITVNYARANSDSAAADDATVSGSSITFAPRVNGVAGDKLKTIAVSIDNDVIDEDAETVIVNLSAGPDNATLGGRATHTLTINADATDPPSVVEFAQSASSTDEANTTRNIGMTITPASGKPITMQYTFGGTASIAGGSGQDDYDPRTLSPFTIQPGSTTFNFQVDINNDNSGEGSETIIINLASPQNATIGTRGVHTVTINASN